MLEEELLSFINLILSSPLGRTSISSYITVTWTINTFVGSDTVIHRTIMGVDYHFSEGGEGKALIGFNLQYLALVCH